MPIHTLKDQKPYQGIKVTKDERAQDSAKLMQLIVDTITPILKANYIKIGHFFEMDPYNPIPQVREKSTKKGKLRSDGLPLIVGIYIPHDGALETGDIGIQLIETRSQKGRFWKDWADLMMAIIHALAHARLFQRGDARASDKANHGPDFCKQLHCFQEQYYKVYSRISDHPSTFMPSNEAILHILKHGDHRGILSSIGMDPIRARSKRDPQDYICEVRQWSVDRKLDAEAAKELGRYLPYYSNTDGDGQKLGTGGRGQSRLLNGGGSSGNRLGGGRGSRNGGNGRGFYSRIGGSGGNAPGRRRNEAPDGNNDDELQRGFWFADLYYPIAQFAMSEYNGDGPFMDAIHNFLLGKSNDVGPPGPGVGVDPGYIQFISYGTGGMGSQGPAGYESADMTGPPRYGGVRILSVPSNMGPGDWGPMGPSGAMRPPDRDNGPRTAGFGEDDDDEQDDFGQGRQGGPPFSGFEGQGGTPGGGFSLGGGQVPQVQQFTDPYGGQHTISAFPSEDGEGMTIRRRYVGPIWSGPGLPPGHPATHDGSDLSEAFGIRRGGGPLSEVQQHTDDDGGPHTFAIYPDADGQGTIHRRTYSRLEPVFGPGMGGGMRSNPFDGGMGGGGTFGGAMAGSSFSGGMGGNPFGSMVGGMGGGTGAPFGMSIGSRGMGSSPFGGFGRGNRGGFGSFGGRGRGGGVRGGFGDYRMSIPTNTDNSNVKAGTSRSSKPPTTATSSQPSLGARVCLELDDIYSQHSPANKTDEAKRAASAQEYIEYPNPSNCDIVRIGDIKRYLNSDKMVDVTQGHVNNRGGSSTKMAMGIGNWGNKEMKKATNTAAMVARVFENENASGDYSGGDQGRSVERSGGTNSSSTTPCEKFAADMQRALEESSMMNAEQADALDDEQFQQLLRSSRADYEAQQREHDGSVERVIAESSKAAEQAAKAREEEEFRRAMSKSKQDHMKSQQAHEAEIEKLKLRTLQDARKKQTDRFNDEVASAAANSLQDEKRRWMQEEEDFQYAMSQSSKDALKFLDWDNEQIEKLKEQSLKEYNSGMSTGRSQEKISLVGESHQIVPPKPAPKPRAPIPGPPLKPAPAAVRNRWRKVDPDALPKAPPSERTEPLKPQPPKIQKKEPVQAPKVSKPPSYKPHPVTGKIKATMSPPPQASEPGAVAMLKRIKDDHEAKAKPPKSSQGASTSSQTKPKGIGSGGLFRSRKLDLNPVSEKVSPQKKEESPTVNDSKKPPMETDKKITKAPESAGSNTSHLKSRAKNTSQSLSKVSPPPAPIMKSEAPNVSNEEKRNEDGESEEEEELTPEQMREQRLRRFG